LADLLKADWNTNLSSTLRLYLQPFLSTFIFGIHTFINILLSNMKYLKLPILLLLALCIATVSPSCSGDTSENASEEDTSYEDQADDEAIDMSDPASALQGMAEKMQEAADQMEKGEQTEVINFRELKKLLPKKVAGLNMEDSEGETAGGMGFKVSNVEAQYSDESSDKRIDITITDVGGATMALMGIAAWSSLEYEKDTDEGYERTTMIDGHKAFEKYYSANQDGEIGVIVADRFVVTVKGRQIEMDDLKSALNKIDLDDLADLATK